MQTAHSQTNESAGRVAYLATGSGAARNDPETTHYGSRGSRNDFLKTPIPKIALHHMVSTHSGIDLVTQENYEYLRDSYFRYAQLLGAVPRHDPVESCGEGIAVVYDALDHLIGETLNVNLEENDGRLQFVLWQTNQWGDNNLYWLPVMFIERLKPKFRRLVITFLHELSDHHGFSAINEWEETQWAVEWMEESIDGTPHEAERQKMREAISSYRDGRAARLLYRIGRRCYYKNCERALRKYVPRDDTERALLGLMSEGMEFIGKGKPSIMDYAYDPYKEENPDYEPIRLEQQVGLVYDCEDAFVENMHMLHNETLQETYEIIPVTRLYLTPQTDRLFVQDDYSTRFFRWADRFISHIRTTYE